MVTVVGIAVVVIESAGIESRFVAQGDAATARSVMLWHRS